MVLKLATLLAAAGTLALAGAASARADIRSSNWGGYAAHRSGVKFEKVLASWTQPSVTCKPGSQSYSSAWVGLGGYSTSSNALEQIGTEVDCSASGRVVSSAWYELVPAASRTIHMRVRPGDVVAAEVIVIGHRVQVSLHDVTSKRWFRKTLYAKTVDVSSADWIVEAPSDCVGANTCQTLPLANFDSIDFGYALAETTTGHLGAISSPAWNRTRIDLVASGRRFVSDAGSNAATGAATPSRLSDKGTAFVVTYSDQTVQAKAAFSIRRGSPRAGSLVHPGR